MGLEMDAHKLRKRSSPGWRMLFIVLCIALMVFAIAMMLAPHSVVAHNGKVTLSNEDFNQNDLV